MGNASPVYNADRSKPCRAERRTVVVSLLHGSSQENQVPWRRSVMLDVFSFGHDTPKRKVECGQVFKKYSWVRGYFMDKVTGII
jgi:hypothetical protein